MKKNIVLATFLCSVSPLFGQLTDMPTDEQRTPIQVPDKPEITLSEEELLKTWGWLLAERFNLGAFNFSSTEMDQISEGMRSHVAGEEPPTNLRESMTQMQRYFAEREERMIGKALRENKAKEQAFFDDLFGLPGVQSLGSGLYYQILEPGSGEKPEPSDTVVVRYEGRFLDNTVFDTTEGRGPAMFKLNEVIEGWTQGLQLIGEGGKIKLYVPAKLGYGDEARPGVPPASTLVFEIELLKVGAPEAAQQGEQDPAANPPATPPVETQDSPAE